MPRFWGAPLLLIALIGLGCSKKSPPPVAKPSPPPSVIPPPPVAPVQPAPPDVPKGETIDALVERWRSGELEDRERATLAIVGRWMEWTESDLAKLLAAMADSDSEVVERSREAMARIRVRRDAGRRLVERLKGLDEAFTRGDDLAKLGVLDEAIRLYERKELTDADLKALEEISGRAAWKDESVLLEKKQAGQWDKVIADRAGLRAKAVERIAAEGKAHSVELLPYLKDKDPEVRTTAFQMLDHLDAREHAPKLVPLFKEANASIRSEALSLLEGWGRKEYAAEFANLLKDPHWSIRGRAIEALGGWGLKEYARPIADLLRDPFGQTRAEAAWALGEFGLKDYAAEILPLLRDPVSAARRNAAFALGKLGAGEHSERILPLLEDADPWVRIGAVQALGMLGKGEHMSAILPLLGQMDSEVRSDAVWVLGRLASRELRKNIVELLEDRHSEVRHDAIRVLERLGAREQEAAIAERLKDSSGWVRAQAAITLGRLGAKDSFGEISRLLDDEDRRARIWAVLGLGELAARSGEAELRARITRRLWGVEGDRDRLVGLSAAMGLIRLGLKDRAGQREVLREFMENSVARPYLGSEILDALAEGNEPESYERLRRPVDVTRPIQTWSELGELVRSSGLRLEVKESYPLGRLEAGTAYTVRGILEWLFGRYAPPEVVLEGSRVLLLSATDAFGHWRKRFEAK